MVVGQLLANGVLLWNCRHPMETLILPGGVQLHAVVRQLLAECALLRDRLAESHPRQRALRHKLHAALAGAYGKQMGILLVEPGNERATGGRPVTKPQRALSHEPHATLAGACW